jgi:hypothetical protein
VELAEALTEAKRRGSWKRWGYDSFDAYATKELSLRQDTVAKLTGSFAFLKARAPEVLDRDGVQAPLPSLRSVDFLRRAENTQSAPADVVTELRRRVLEEGASEASVRREFGPLVFPVSKDDAKKRERAGLRNVATKLRELVSQADTLPKGLATESLRVLDRLLEELNDESSKAA